MSDIDVIIAMAQNEAFESYKTEIIDKLGDEYDNATNYEFRCGIEKAMQIVRGDNN